MNCQSEACARSNSRAACASTGRAAATARAAGAAFQKAFSSAPSRGQVQAVRSLSHIEWSPFTPQDPSARRTAARGGRSEERRVGKEWRARGVADDEKNK